ncbi:MAG: hypothetical protein DMF60_13445, partial [Acidobacteria bacterium]
MALWLRLERIGVERGTVVFDLQVVQPIQIVEHEGRPKTKGVPVLKIAVDARSAFAENPSGVKKLPVVVQVVNANFKTVARQFFAQLT